MTKRPPRGGDPERKARICEALAEGVPLREICRDPMMPAWRTVYDWEREDPDFAAAIARARRLGAHHIAQDALDIADAAPERTERGTIDPGSVQHAKLRVETRLKLLAKWSPRDYGDKIGIGHADGLDPLQSTATITTTDPKQAAAEYAKIIKGGT